MTIRLSLTNGYWWAVLLDGQGNTTHAVGRGDTRAEAVGYILLNYPNTTGTRIVEGSGR